MDIFKRHREWEEAIINQQAMFNELQTLESNHTCFDEETVDNEKKMRRWKQHKFNNNVKREI